MSNKKTPEQRAEKWAYDNEARDFGTLVCPTSGAVAAFLAGRADFIANELPGLLEKAREVSRIGWPVIEGPKYTIEELIKLAEKEEP